MNEEVEFKVYAFVKYNLFPYFTMHQTSKIRDDLKVYLPDFGAWVKPLFTMSLEDGRIFYIKVNKLEEQKRSDERKLKEEYLKKLEKLMENNFVHIER